MSKQTSSRADSIEFAGFDQAEQLDESKAGVEISHAEKV